MLDPVKEKELHADIESLEVGPLNPQSYEKMATLKLVQFFQDLEDMGGLSRFLGMAERAEPVSYSHAAAPERTVGRHGDSEFLETVAGKDAASAWAVMDGLMDTLKAVREKVYLSVLEQVRRI